jgi:6-phosphofructokinase 2
MANIATLTINPAIDLSTAVERMMPGRKLRCKGLQRDPGGGGINVARVARRLGSEVIAVYTCGGIVGRLLEELVTREGIESRTVEVAAETRENFTVHVEESGQQFRFVLAGPQMTETEWQGCLNAVCSLEPFPRYLVASGSLPPGVPDDFFARVAQAAREHGAKFLLDTSGPPLKAALAEGVYLIKPNLHELMDLVHVCADDQEGQAGACRRIVEQGQAQIVALTLADKGALLTTRDGTWRAPALPVEPTSVVGAGDSFLGGMTWSLGQGHSVETAFRYAVAAGSAALLQPGTELCHGADIKRLFHDVKLQRVWPNGPETRWPASIIDGLGDRYDTKLKQVLGDDRLCTPSTSCNLHTGRMVERLD